MTVNGLVTNVFFWLKLFLYAGRHKFLTKKITENSALISWKYLSNFESHAIFVLNYAENAGCMKILKVETYFSSDREIVSGFNFHGKKCFSMSYYNKNTLRQIIAHKSIPNLTNLIWDQKKYMNLMRTSSITNHHSFYSDFNFAKRKN